MKCPLCGSDMVLRTARKGKFIGQKFYGCSQYPECNATIDYEETMKPGLPEKPQPAGKIENDNLAMCPSCGGTGFRFIEHYHRSKKVEKIMCNNCSGRGWIDMKTIDAVREKKDDSYSLEFP